MIEVDRKLPRPVNHGAVTLVAVLSLAAVLFGGWVGMIPSLDGPCEPAPNLASTALLCGGLTLVGLFGPLFVILPPTDPPVSQDGDGLAWNRPRIGVLTTFVGLAWLVWLGSAVFGLVMAGSEPIGPMCDPLLMSATQRDVVDADWGWFYGSWAGLAVLGLGLGTQMWRSSRVRTVELDARGVHVDGERLPFNDIDRVEVEDRALVIHRYDGARIRVGLWRRERAFAARLADAIRAHLPAHAEAREDSRERLVGLTRHDPSPE